MNYFFDISALIKLYHQEIGFEKTRSLYNEPTAEIYISQLAYTEVYSAFYVKLRNKEIKDEKIILEAIHDFEIDMQYISVIAVDELIINKSKSLIIKFGMKHALRTLDALHLASVDVIAGMEEITFVTADVRQADTANDMGLKTINVITFSY